MKLGNSTTNFTAYFINLDSREERRELMQQRWGETVNLKRIQGVKLPNEQFGARGCFAGHTNAFKTLKEFQGLRIVMEDDIIPTSNFTNKLLACLSELPKDWNVLMLGFNISARTKFTKVTEKISKANWNVLAGHCYIINPSFYEIFEKELENENNAENFDVLLMNLQLKYNVYMCVPTLCYQYESFSDNSNRVVGNTESTKKYFQE